jgi:hypothetical protein
MPENATTEAVTKGKQKARRTYSRHGLHTLRARVKVSGLSAVDARTAAAQALISWRKELLTDLGGEENISSQRAALVELAVRTRLFVDHIDAFLLSQPSLVNRKKKSMLPILSERLRLVDCLSNLLSKLGLDRVASPMPSLAEYVAAKEAQ